MDAGAASRAVRTGIGEPGRSPLDCSEMGVMALRKPDCAGFASLDLTTNSWMSAGFSVRVMVAEPPALMSS